MSTRRPVLSDFPYFRQGMKFIQEIDESYMMPGCREPDCIPSIDTPKWISGEEYDWGKLLIVINPTNETEAYGVPRKILDLHEVVNFNFLDGTRVAITYCPLCDTSAAYLREIEGIEIVLGVSGLLYNSAVILYDRKTLSLFSQVYSKGIHGKYAEKKLMQLPVIEMGLNVFFKTFPKGRVLSNETGFPRRMKMYPKDRYQEYRKDNNLSNHFQVREFNLELPVKERVYHLSDEGVEYIITQNALKRNDLPFEVSIRYNTPLFFKPNHIDEWEKWIPSTISYYFAARAYYPDAILLD